MCEYKTISCLVVSEDRNIKECASKLLHASNKKENYIEVVNKIKDAKEELSNKAYDLLLVDLHEIDYDDFDILLNNIYNAPAVIIITEASKYDKVFKLTYNLGYLVLPRPVTVHNFIQAVHIGINGYEKKKADPTNTKKIGEIRFQDQAKLLLVLHEKMDEQSAHRYVEKLSMDLRVPKLKSAEYVIGRYVKC